MTLAVEHPAIQEVLDLQASHSVDEVIRSDTLR